LSDPTDLRALRESEKNKRALASYLIGRTVLQKCVAVLAPLGIPVVPLKGLWLQQFVYRETGSRLISDVDVLVPQGRYAQARYALLQAGWRPHLEDFTEASFFAPGLPLAIDVHADLYTRGVFHTALDQIFARAKPDTEAFGCPVLLPDPLDVLSHLVGHALKGSGAWTGSGKELLDIPRMAECLGLSPQLCAARLEQNGLARAARFVLPLTAANDRTQFGARTLACLRRDPFGVWLAHVLLGLQRVQPDNAHAHTVVGFMLDSSLWRAGYALSLRVVDLRRRLAAPSGD
jgi:hypothetical protein